MSQQHPTSQGQTPYGFDDVWHLVTDPARRRHVLLAEAERLREVLRQRTAELRAASHRFPPTPKSQA